MKRILKFGTIAAFLALCLAAPQALAGGMVMKGSSCNKSTGSNKMTYDCNFKVRGYELGTPVTFEVHYDCTGDCSKVLSFGLKNKGFTPKCASGAMVGGERLDDGLKVTFVFNSTCNGVANGHFTMNVGLYDAAGVMKVVPAGIHVNLNR